MIAGIQTSAKVSTARKKPIAITRFRNSTKIWLGSSRSITHQDAAQTISIAASMKKRFRAIGKRTANHPEVAP